MPPLPQTPGLTWRPLTADDVEDWFALLETIERYDDEHERSTLGGLRQAVGQPWVDLAADSLVGVDPVGDLRAVGRVIHRPGVAEEVKVILVGGVHPAWRGRGVGRALLAWQCRRGAEKAREARAHDPVAAARPARLTVPVGDRSAARERLACAAGFTPIRYFSEMRRPLPADPQDRAYGAAPLPTGVALEPFASDWSEPVRRAHNEAFGDHWGSTEMDEQMWRSSLMQDEAFRPALSMVAVDRTGAESVVAGYVLNMEHRQDWAVQGFSEGYTDAVGVRRPWRGQGIARALLQASARVFVGAGHRWAALDVDTDNPTGALGVYTALGYEPTRRTTVYAQSVEG